MIKLLRLLFPLFWGWSFAEEGGGGNDDGDGDGGGNDDDPQTVPYSRFKEVIDERKELQESVQTLKNKIAGMEGAVTKKTKPLEEKVDTLTNDLKDMQSELEQERQEREAEKRKRLRLEAATQAGIPADLAGRLQGESAEELQEDAERLKAFLKESSPGVPPSGEGGGGTPKRMDISTMTPAEIRKNRDKLIEQVQAGEE